MHPKLADAVYWQRRRNEEEKEKIKKMKEAPTPRKEWNFLFACLYVLRAECLWLWPWQCFTTSKFSYIWVFFFVGGEGGSKEQQLQGPLSVCQYMHACMCKGIKFCCVAYSAVIEFDIFSNFLCVCVCFFFCAHVHKCVCVCAHVCVCVCVRAHVCVCVFLVKFSLGKNAHCVNRTVK